MQGNKFKARNTIKVLKEELENNKRVYGKNPELLQHKLEMEKASLEDFEMEQKKYNLSKDMLDIELKNYRVITPLMEFHALKEWQEKWKEFKQFEIEMNERNFKTAQKNYETQTARISQMINEDKIKEQQQKIEERNQEILIKLRELGEPVDEKIEKQDYVG